VRGYAKEVKDLYQAKVDAARAKPSAAHVRGGGGAGDGSGAAMAVARRVSHTALLSATAGVSAAPLGAYPPVPPRQGGDFASFAQTHRVSLGGGSSEAKGESNGSGGGGGGSGGGGSSVAGSSGGGGPAASAAVLARGHVGSWDVAGVGCWLAALGLSEVYGDAFHANEISGAVLLEVRACV
jgi:hypothetical protein